MLQIFIGIETILIRQLVCIAFLQIFYWTHLLYVPFWLLLLFHGPNFWKWFAIPGTVYISERIMRLAWLR